MRWGDARHGRRQLKTEGGGTAAWQRRVVGNLALAPLDVRSRHFVCVLVPGAADRSGKADGLFPLGSHQEQSFCVTFARDSQPPNPKHSEQGQATYPTSNPTACFETAWTNSINTLTPTNPRFHSKSSPPSSNKVPPNSVVSPLYFYRPRHPGRLIGASQTPKAGCRPIRC